MSKGESCAIILNMWERQVHRWKQKYTVKKLQDKEYHDREAVRELWG